MNTWRTYLSLAGFAATGVLFVQLRHERSEREQQDSRIAALSTAQRRIAADAARESPAQAALGRMVAGATIVASAAPAPAAGASPPPVEPNVRLAGAFGAERPDPAWTDAASRLAGDRLGAALPASSALRSVECRSSLCRIETVHPDMEHYQQFFQRAFIDQDTRAWNGAVTTAELTEAGDGSVHVISYLAREGSPLLAADPGAADPAGPAGPAGKKG